MNTELTVRLPSFSTPFAETGSEDRYLKRGHQAIQARKNGSLTSDLKKAYIHACLENDLNNHTNSAVAMKIFFDIKHDGNPIQKECLIKTEESGTLEIKNLFPIIESILIELEKDIRDDGVNLDIAYKIFTRSGHPKIKFKELFCCISNKQVTEGAPSYGCKKINKAMEDFLRTTNRPIEPQIDENFKFIDLKS